MDELEYVTDAHRRMYHLIDSVALWQSVNGHLRLLLALLRGREPERVLRRLAALGMEAAELAAWLAFDLRDHSAREHHFALAFELSGVARDSPLTAYVRGFRSVTEYVEDRPHRALALACQAGEEGAGATATTRAWLAGVRGPGVVRRGGRRRLPLVVGGGGARVGPIPSS